MSNVHALVVDDNEFNLKVLARLLGAAGATYTIVQDPTRIEGILQTIEKLDIIFLDLEMPEINGYELLPILRKRLGTAIPIVACTVHTGEMKTAHDLGFHSFLGKPLHVDRFNDQLSRILSGEPVWDTGAVSG